MAQQTINVGTAPNDGTGTPLRTAFQYTNSNFTELYTATGPSGNNINVPGAATITGNLTVDTNTLFVDSANNRVGIGTASPITPWDVRSNGNAAALFLRTTDPAAAVSSAYIQAPVSTGFSSTVPVYGFWYQNSGMGNPAADTLNWIIASGEAMRLNSTGLGVGYTPSGSADKLGSAATLGVVATGVTADLNFRNSSLTAIQRIRYTDGTGVLTIGSATGTAYPVELGGSTSARAVTIDASSNLGIGVTPSARLDVQTATGDCSARVKSNAAGSNATFVIDYVDSYGTHIIKKSGTDVWLAGVIADTGATPNYKIQNASAVGVQLVSGATAWTTLSDETMKDIIEPISNAVAKVGSLRSVIGKFKTDDSNKRRSFLIAQDVQSVLPEAVDVIGENNELGLRYTEVIPLLVAAIKELTAEVNALKNA